MSTTLNNFSTPAFIIKLYDILEDHNTENFSDIIKWAEDGASFIVRQPKLMEQEVLLHYFKHNHFTSFLRQLNMYDFIKTRNGQNFQVFSHPYFKKNQKNLLNQIKRNPIKTKKDELMFKKTKKIAKSKSERRSSLSENQEPLEKEIHQIKLNQATFEQQFTQVFSQNENIIEQHRQIWGELQFQRKIMDGKIDRMSFLLSWVHQQINDQSKLNQKSIPDLNQFLNLNHLVQQNDKNRPVPKCQNPRALLNELEIKDYKYMDDRSADNQLSSILQLLIEQNNNPLKMRMAPIWPSMNDMALRGNQLSLNQMNFIQLSPTQYLNDDSFKHNLISPQPMFQLTNGELGGISSHMMSPFSHGFKSEPEGNM